MYVAMYQMLDIGDGQNRLNGFLSSTVLIINEENHAKKVDDVFTEDIKIERDTDQDPSPGISIN